MPTWWFFYRFNAFCESTVIQMQSKASLCLCFFYSFIEFSGTRVKKETLKNKLESHEQLTMRSQGTRFFFLTGQHTQMVIAWHSEYIPDCRDRVCVCICAQLKIEQQVQCVKRALGRISETHQSTKQLKSPLILNMQSDMN